MPPSGLTLPGSVFIILDEASQTEISHFANQVISHQDVGGPEVSVHVVHPLHIRHARSNLRDKQTLRDRLR